MTLVSALMLSVQLLVPEQPPPDQPEKAKPVSGIAVRVTAVPLRYVVEQVAPQFMPAGALATVPLPDPALTTLRLTGCEKLAVTLTSPLMTTVQAPVPEQPSDQPTKEEPASGVAVRVTDGLPS